MKIAFDKKEMEFLKKYCSEWGKLSIIEENKESSLEPQELEELFWENIRWLITEYDPDKKEEKIKSFSDEEFIVLCKLFSKTSCIMEGTDIIAVSGINTRLKKEAEIRQIDLEFNNGKCRNLERIHILTENELEDIEVNKNKRFHQFASLYEEYTEKEPEDLFRFIIPPKETDMLFNTITPKKLDLFKIPFDNCYLDCNLETDKAKFPYGFFLCNGEIYDLETEGDIDGYILFIPFIMNRENKDEEVVEMLELHLNKNKMLNKKDLFIQNVYNKEAIQEFNKTEAHEVFDWMTKPNFWKELGLKEVIGFVCNYLLFLNDPRVSYRFIPKQSIKEYKQQEYIFREPKTLQVELTDELKKYLNDFQREKTGIKMNYQYKYIIRGHFRTLRSERYKEHKRIWITPYFKGKGKFYKKDYILVKKK